MFTLNQKATYQRINISQATKAPQASAGEPTLMKTAKLWLALRAASRLSLYFWVMCGISMFTRVSAAW